MYWTAEKRSSRKGGINSNRYGVAYKLLTVDRLFVIRGNIKGHELMARHEMKVLRLMFGPRIALFLMLVWRKEPFADGRTSIREAREMASIGHK